MSDSEKKFFTHRQVILKLVHKIKSEPILTFIKNNVIIYRQSIDFKASLGNTSTTPSRLITDGWYVKIQ